MQNNQLTGIIPDAIGNLARLKNLYLLNNRLEGTIPNGLGSLPNLGTM